MSRLRPSRERRQLGPQRGKTWSTRLTREGQMKETSRGRRALKLAQVESQQSRVRRVGIGALLLTAAQLTKQLVILAIAQRLARVPRRQRSRSSSNSHRTAQKRLPQPGSQLVQHPPPTPTSVRALNTSSPRPQPSRLRRAKRQRLSWLGMAPCLSRCPMNCPRSPSSSPLST